MIRTGQFVNHFFRNRDRQLDMAIAAMMAALILLTGILLIIIFSGRSGRFIEIFNQSLCPEK
ncbi:MAG TPA: hypothetical protein ENN22_15950 [bacterium]|nr:hypothetical protein [bacterium]